MKAIRCNKALEPCWVLLPHHAGDMPTPHKLLSAMHRSGVRAARLFPRLHNFSLKPWCCGELLTALESHRIPTFIDRDQTDYDELHALCSEHPKLPVILTAAGYRENRFLFSLWERHRNLYVSISWLGSSHRVIEETVKRFGAEQLLFDTRQQTNDPGVAITTVSYADVSPEAKQLIARGNTERLLALAGKETK